MESDLIQSLTALLAANPKGRVEMTADETGLALTVRYKRSELDKDVLRKLASVAVDHSI